MTLTEFVLLYITLGALVGFMAGLVGAGGGGIVVPVLTSIFIYQGIGDGKSVHMAVGTALASMIVSSVSSLRAHAARDNVDWKIVFSMAPGIIVGAYVITRFSAHLHSAIISMSFSVMMALVALQYFIDWQPKIKARPAAVYEVMAVGSVIGTISGLVAAGSGFLTVLYLGFRNVEVKRAIGTAAAIGFPIAVVGTVGFMIGGWAQTSDTPYTLGFVYLPAFIAIAISSSLAAPLGARLSHRIPGLYLKRVLAVIALVLGIRMLLLSIW